VSRTIAEITFAAIDFESAGNRPGGTDAPVQIGIAEMTGMAPGESFSSYIASDTPIVWSARKVHGITDDDIAGSPRLVDLWPGVKRLLAGRWIVAHGAATEKRFLRAFPFHGFGPWVDTLKLARAMWPTLPSFSLGDVVRSLGLEDSVRAWHPEHRWHDALSDAIASLVVLRRVIEEAGLVNNEPTILLRADDSTYHRTKGLRQARKTP